jgi:hypothetical protein
VARYVSATSDPLSISLSDRNGDGNLEMVAGSSGISVFLGNGDGTFQPGLIFPSRVGRAVAWSWISMRAESRISPQRSSVLEGLRSRQLNSSSPFGSQAWIFFISEVVYFFFNTEDLPALAYLTIKTDLF